MDKQKSNNPIVLNNLVNQLIKQGFITAQEALNINSPEDVERIINEKVSGVKSFIKQNTDLDLKDPNSCKECWDNNKNTWITWIVILSIIAFLALEYTFGAFSLLLLSIVWVFSFGKIKKSPLEIHKELRANIANVAAQNATKIANTMNQNPTTSKMLSGWNEFIETLKKVDPVIWIVAAVLIGIIIVSVGIYFIVKQNQEKTARENENNNQDVVRLHKTVIGLRIDYIINGLDAIKKRKPSVTPQANDYIRELTVLKTDAAKATTKDQLQAILQKVNVVDVDIGTKLA